MKKILSSLFILACTFSYGQSLDWSKKKENAQYLLTHGSPINYQVTVSPGATLTNQQLTLLETRFYNMEGFHQFAMEENTNNIIIQFASEDNIERLKPTLLGVIPEFDIELEEINFSL